MSSGLKKWACAGATLVLIAGCAAPERPRPEVNRYGVNVAVEHSGSAITLERDQELVVRLASLVSSGSEWALVDFAPGVLTGQAAPKFERELRVNNVNDAAGFEVWRFKPAAAGTVTLKFDYRRAYRLDAASQSVSYTVTVR